MKGLTPHQPPASIPRLTYDLKAQHIHPVWILKPGTDEHSPVATGRWAAMEQKVEV
jgi:hypothetical protein